MWWEALKFGPAGLAALVAAWTAGLLTIELQREKGVRQGAKSLIVYFMAFSLILTGLSYGVAVYDKTVLEPKREFAEEKKRLQKEVEDVKSQMQTQLDEIEGRMQQIGNTISAIDATLIYKA